MAQGAESCVVALEVLGDTTDGAFVRKKICSAGRLPGNMTGPSAWRIALGPCQSRAGLQDIGSEGISQRVYRGRPLPTSTCCDAHSASEMGHEQTNRSCRCRVCLCSLNRLRSAAKFREDGLLDPQNHLRQTCVGLRRPYRTMRRRRFLLLRKGSAATSISWLGSHRTSARDHSYCFQYVGRPARTRPCGQP
jgi:hypothetical protein